MRSYILLATLAVISPLAGCSGGSPAAHKVEVDGSSTVFVLSQAVAEEFGAENPDVAVTVKSSGTGGGFKRFVTGELAIAGASRPITTEELELAKQNSVEFIELPVCFDAITVAVHKQNDWIESITVDELKKIWGRAAERKITHWNQINPKYPNHEIGLFGAGADSGTFEYFTEAVCGGKGNHRQDYGGNENDNVIIQNIEGDKHAMGYIPYAYFESHRDTLKALKIDWKADDDQQPVEPSVQNVIEGKYNPLARPLFIYVNRKSAEQPHIKAFVEYFLDNAEALAKDVDYVPLPTDAYPKVKQRFATLKTGTVFDGKAAVGMKLEDIVKAE